MEFITEFIFEVLLEGLLGLTVENPKAKTWVKTSVVSILCCIVLALFAFVAYIGWKEQDWLIIALGGGLFAAFTALSLRMIPKRHKEDWKQE